MHTIFFSTHPAVGQLAVMPAIQQLLKDEHLKAVNVHLEAAIVVVGSDTEYTTLHHDHDTRHFCFLSRSPQTVHNGTFVGDLLGTLAHIQALAR
jgi:hypothetical protein